MIEPKQLAVTRDGLMNLLRHRVFPNGVNTAIEVGVWRGEFSAQMCNRLQPNGFWGVDPYELYEGYTDKPGAEFNNQTSLDQLYEAVNRNYSRINTVGTSKLLRMQGSEAAAKFEDEYFDVVYIDADHKYEAVKADIQTWWPKVRQGGVLVGHDYIERSHVEEFGVIPAVQEFVAEHNLKFWITSEAFASWIVFKGEPVELA